MAQEAGISQAKVKNNAKQIELTVTVASEKMLNVVLKTPKVQFYLHTENVCIVLCQPVCIYTLFITILTEYYRWPFTNLALVSPLICHSETPLLSWKHTRTTGLTSSPSCSPRLMQVKTLEESLLLIILRLIHRQLVEN